MQPILYKRLAATRLLKELLHPIRTIFFREQAAAIGHAGAWPAWGSIVVIIAVIIFLTAPLSAG